MMTKSQRVIISQYLSKDKFILDCYAKGLCDKQECISACGENVHECLKGLTESGMDIEPAIATIQEARTYDRGEAIL